MVDSISIGRSGEKENCGELISSEIKIINRLVWHIIKVGNTGLKLTYKTDLKGSPIKIKLDFEPNGYWYINEGDPEWEIKISKVFCFALFHLINWANEIVHSTTPVGGLDERTYFSLKSFFERERIKNKDNRIFLEQKTNKCFKEFVLRAFKKFGWEDFIKFKVQVRKAYFMTVDITELIYLGEEDKGLRLINYIAKVSSKIIMYEPSKFQDFINTIFKKVI